MNFTLYGFDLCAAYANVQINQIKKKCVNSEVKHLTLYLTKTETK